MDCNNYSYTAPGFGIDYEKPIDEYSNDDMNATLDYWKNQYSATPANSRYNDYIVMAYSYDGQMDISEVFTTMDAARALYTHIVDNYSDTPPVKRELRKLINSLHRQEKGVA